MPTLAIDRPAAPAKGFFARLFAPIAAMRDALAETEAMMATHLLTFDDATLHALGYRRADLRRGQVRPLTVD